MLEPRDDVLKHTFHIEIDVKDKISQQGEI